MADKSAIEWTEATLNPWTGCTKVSPGCARCYLPRTMPFRTAGRDFDRTGHIPLVFHMDRLERMIRRRKPTMYFVNSLSDLFHEDASDEQIAAVFAAFVAAPQHTFQCLTKRPERMQPLLSSERFCELVQAACEAMVDDPDDAPAPRRGLAYGLENVWLGVSIENRRFVHRADLLRATPAAVRFISAEPLLGPLLEPEAMGMRLRPGPRCGPEFVGPWLDLTGISWCIVGGESGKGARRFDLQWARDLRDACAATGTAYFLKQLGGSRPGSRLDELPEDLRIREFPRQAVTA